VLKKSTPGVSTAKAIKAIRLTSSINPHPAISRLNERNIINGLDVAWSSEPRDGGTSRPTNGTKRSKRFKLIPAYAADSVPF
jgi:hypothetical protein